MAKTTIKTLSDKNKAKKDEPGTRGYKQIQAVVSNTVAGLMDCWHLKINKKFRIFGVLINETFYIALIDPKHEIHSR